MDKDQKQAISADSFDSFLFFVRAYFVPLVGLAIIVLVIVFIYFPNISGISDNLAQLKSDNQQYQNIKDKIAYYKNLSTSDQQLSLTDNIVAVNAILPDQINTADDVNAIQNVILQDGVSVISASSQVLTNNALVNVFPNINKDVIGLQITFHVKATSDKIIPLLNDISNSKQLSYISTVDIQGKVNQPGDDQINFLTNIFALDSNILTKNLNLLSSFRTDYTVDKLNNL